jgi:general secretion pathway protein J
MRARPGPTGFTLIELLIAITVLTIVALISWRGLESLAATRERLEPEADELRAMVAVFGQLELDLAQAADPQFISLPMPPITAGDGGESALQIIRTVPAEAEQALSLQRVIYSVRDGRLAREVSTPVKYSGLLAQAELASVPLLPKVTALRVRVWKNGEWIEGAAGLTTPDMLTQLPFGVEITLQRSDATRLRKVVVIR